MKERGIFLVFFYWELIDVIRGFKYDILNTVTIVDMKATGNGSG